MLIPLLKSDRENDRFVAAQALGEYGPAARAAIGDLLPLLQSAQFERNRAAAAKAFGQILKDAAPSEEVDRVAEALAAKFNEAYDAYSDVRREAVRAIGMIGPAAKRVIPKLTQALTDFKLHSREHRLVRQAAAWTCGRMGPLAAEHIDRLISMLHEEGRHVPEVAEAIGLIGPVHDNVVPNLIDVYERSGYPDSWLPLKIHILEAWVRFGPKAATAVPMVQRVLRAHARSLPASLRVSMMRFFAAVGPAARAAEAEILAQVQYQPNRPDDPDEKRLREEAIRAYRAVVGQDHPGAATP